MASIQPDYMVPDMSECNSGKGTDTFDMFAAMQRWVEQGGSADDIRNFDCRRP